MHKLAQNVLAYVRKQDLIRAGDRVGIALSGGADSVALLRLMLELRQEIGVVLSVIHLNHKLRGAESDADEAFVREFAQKHGLELICDSRDVTVRATEYKLSLEAAGRAFRYEFFRSTLEGGLNRIATAHTLDDQAETLLLKLARGSGTRGLAGIWPKVAASHRSSAISEDEKHGDPSIVRPLLCTRRQDLRVYLAEIGQSWREDSSNRDLRHTRNRIRHGILPRFERHVNPRFCETLAETAEIARSEEEYWATEIARLLPQIWREDTLDCTMIGTFPLAVRRRLVRRAAESLGLTLEFHHVEEVLELKGCVSLPAGWRARRDGDGIKFHKEPTTRSDYAYPLSVPGKVEIPELRLAIETMLVNEAHGPDDLLESSFAKHELVLRNWRIGERFWPAHTREARKIKEILQDRHVIGDQKKSWPVIASGGEVVWMRGFGVRRDFRAKGEKGVLIRESPLEN